MSRSRLCGLEDPSCDCPNYGINKGSSFQYFRWKKWQIQGIRATFHLWEKSFRVKIVHHQQGCVNVLPIMTISIEQLLSWYGNNTSDLVRSEFCKRQCLKEKATHKLTCIWVVNINTHINRKFQAVRLYDVTSLGF